MTQRLTQSPRVPGRPQTCFVPGASGKGVDGLTEFAEVWDTFASPAPTRTPPTSRRAANSIISYGVHAFLISSLADEHPVIQSSLVACNRIITGTSPPSRLRRRPMRAAHRGFPAHTRDAASVGRESSGRKRRIATNCDMSRVVVICRNSAESTVTGRDPWRLSLAAGVERDGARGCGASVRALTGCQARPFPRSVDGVGQRGDRTLPGSQPEEKGRRSVAAPADGGWESSGRH